MLNDYLYYDASIFKHPHYSITVIESATDPDP